MSYSKYPYAIDGVTELPLSTDNKTPVRSEVTNRLRDSIVKIENELGIKPSGIYSTVRERMDVLTISVGDLTKYIKRDGTRPFTGNQSMGNHKLTNLAPATNDKDALSYGQSGANLADLIIDTGNFTFTGTNINLDPSGSFDLAMDNGQVITINISDNLSSSFLIQDNAGLPYLNISTVNGFETIIIGNPVTNPNYIFLGNGTFTQSGIGQVTFNGNIDAKFGLDISGSDLTMTGTNIDLDPTGTFDLDMSLGTTITILLADSLDPSFWINEGGNNYIEINTGTEIINFGNAVTNPDYYFIGSGTFTQLGAGQVTFNGNVDAANGLDVSGADLIMSGVDIDLAPTGTFDLDMSLGTTATIVLANNLNEAFVIKEGANFYLEIDTLGEEVNFGNAVTNPDYTFLGSGTFTQSGAGQVEFNGNVDTKAGLDVIAGEFTVSSTATNIDLDPTGLFTLDMDAAQTVTITIDDNLDAAFLIKEGVGNNYFEIDTRTPNIEIMNFGNTTTNPDYAFLGSGTFTQSGAGQVEFNGNVDATNGLDVSGADLVMTGTNIDLDPTGAFDLDMSLGTTVTISLANNLDEAFVIKEGANFYLEIDTTDNPLPVEIMNFGNTNTNPDYAFLGSGTFTQSGAGQVEFNGNVDATNGLDVTAGAFTVSSTATNIDLDPTGLFTLDMDAAQTVTITIVAAVAAAFLIKEGIGNNYFEIDTRTPNIEIMNFGNTTTNPDYAFLGSGTFTQSGVGQVTFNGNVDAKLGLDISGGTLVMTGTNIDLDPTGTFTLTMTGSNTTTISIADETDASFLIKEVVNNKNYFEIDTTGSLEIMNFGNTDTNPDYAFLGSGTFTQSGAGQVTFNGNIDATNGLDISGSSFTMTGTSINLDPTGTFTLDMDAGQAVTITIADDLDPSFLIKDINSKNYFEIDTTGSIEIINFGNTDTNPDYAFLGSGTFTQSGAGQVEFNGNVDVSGGLDITAGNFTMIGTDVDLDPTGTFSLTLTAGAATITIVNDLDASFLIKQAGFNYFEIDTRASELINIGNTTTNPSFIFIGNGLFTQSGTGQVEFNGNVDAKAGLDVTAGYSFTMTGTNIDLDPTGTFALNMANNQTITITIDDILDAAFLIKDINSRNYFEIDTRSPVEIINFGNTTTNPDYEFLGSGTFTQSGAGQVTFNGNVNANNGIDVLAGAFTVASSATNIDLDPTGTFTLDMDSGQPITIRLGAAATNAMLITDTISDLNYYLKINTSLNYIYFGNSATNPDVSFLGTGTFTQSGTGQVSFAGNVDANRGLDVGVSYPFTMTGTNIDLDPTGTFDLSMDATKGITITISDDLDASFLIMDSTTSNYFEIDTRNGAEIINFGNAGTNPKYYFLGTGTTTFNGNVDAKLGLDVTAGAFTFTGTTFDLDPTDHFTLDMDGGKTVTITLANTLNSAFWINEGGNNYFEIDTSGEEINFGNSTTDPLFSFLGDGTFTKSGSGIISLTGAITIFTSIDCYTNSAPFRPRRVSNATEPVPATGEMLIWYHTDDGKVYCMYNDPVATTKKVELV